jgi:hypothetical protein
LTEAVIGRPATDGDRAVLTALAKEQARLAELLLGLTSGNGGKEHE